MKNPMPYVNGRFYMNPAYGRAVEAVRGHEVALKGPERQPSTENAHWVTIAGRHVLIEDSGTEPSANRPDQTHKPEVEDLKKPNRAALPESGLASIYADSFEGKITATGERFDQNGYTAALLPRSRWHALRLGTHVELSHNGNRVVVEVNDRGAGDRNPGSRRVLDLSRAAASSLTGRDIDGDDESRKVGLIRLDKIRVVSADTPLGPVKAR